jgi:AcrR family transcriptional regulator
MASDAHDRERDSHNRADHDHGGRGVVDAARGGATDSAAGGARARRGRPRDPGVDESILSSTLSLLGEVGYAQLTMEQVAARARVGKASLYLRWPSKVALVADAIQRLSPDLVPPVPDTGNLPSDMREFLRHLVRPRSAAAEAALPAVAGEAASNPEMREAFRHGVALTLVESVRAIVQRAVDRGELPASTDVELLALLPMALLQQLRLAQEQRPDEQMADRIVVQFYTPS